jgi:Short C-terminal domain
MTHADQAFSTRLKHVLVCAGLLVAALPAQAGLFDSLFGGATAVKVDPSQRLWRIGEFTTVQLVSAEAGAGPNQHPARVTADALRWQLGGIRTTVDDKMVALFAADEVNEFAEPLAQALAAAGPADDVLLVSSSRRGASFLTDVTAVTARLFVQDGSLQFIVRDARAAFVKEYINSRNPPKFNHGSRASASGVALVNSSATSRRGDWLALGLSVPGAAPAVVAAPVIAAPVAGMATPTAPAAAVPAVQEPLQTEAEHRLATLKRLRDRGLISEEEFQEKRKEVLKLL